MVAVPNIREAHPLKQGLKLSAGYADIISYNYSRGTSIKTRIETEGASQTYGHRDSRGTSIKTRIETFNILCFYHSPMEFERHIH